MTTPRPDLLPEGATLIEWKLIPEVYAKARVDWRQWPPGDWDGEPDRIEWRSAGSPLPRLMVRGPLGSWCGYVGVPEGHPLFGKNYDDAATEALDAHGGLTYAAACSGSICHVPREGESDHVWWFGFDCAHLGDVTPGLLRYELGPSPFGESYRDVWYVSREVERLASQLDERKPEP